MLIKRIFYRNILQLMVSNISRLMRLLVKYFISSQVDPAGLWEEADGGIIV